MLKDCFMTFLSFFFFEISLYKGIHFTIKLYVIASSFWHKYTIFSAVELADALKLDGWGKVSANYNIVIN